MSRVTLSTPSYGRRDSQSALDFVYWTISAASVFYTRRTTVPSFVGSASDELMSVQLVVSSARQIGVALPTALDYIMNMCAAAETVTTVAVAIRTRGAILFRNRGIAVSLGDSKRIVEVAGGDVVVRYLTTEEFDATFWTAALVPGVVYL